VTAEALLHEARISMPGVARGAGMIHTMTPKRDPLCARNRAKRFGGLKV
jgi:hypothetical protein